MDVHKIFKSVQSLSDYVSITQDVLHAESSKIIFNMSTVLALKKIRSLEIDFFKKSNDRGAAFVLFERMLLISPSKTWGLLGKELILLIQYWLEAVRRDLIIHNTHWWMFLSPLLTFIKEIRSKDKNLPSVLVQETAECLLDLANCSKLEVLQRYQILQCLNMFSAESSREVRLAVKDKTDNYLTKLSRQMATCGHQPTQLAIMETLLRWLINRQHKAVRELAAMKWFPEHTYPVQAREGFLSAQWMDFYQDARNFLNIHNESNDLVTSVMCYKMIYGKHVIISEVDRRQSWLDVNSVNRTLSISVDSRSLSPLGVSGGIFETLTLCERDEVVLTSESEEMILTVRPSDAPLLIPSLTSLDKAEIKFTIAPDADFKKFGKALKNAFGDNYEEHDVRLSHPTEVRRYKHSGYVARSNHGDGWKSPSTVSTTSLAHLHEKLAALPHYPFDKERVSVCDQPQLSSVTEVSETDERSLNSTLKLRHFGICERVKTKDTRKFQSDNEERYKIRNLSPVAKSNNVEISLLHVATIGSDESVINETIERLSKRDDFRTDNIVDLLLQEALEGKPNPVENNFPSEKKTPRADNQCSNDAIENTPYANEIKAKNDLRSNKKQTVNSNSTTTDESNTEVISETPVNYVNVRKKGLRRKHDKGDGTTTSEKESMSDKQIDEKTIEDFFSKHFAENKNGELIVSPTLAKKINESSSVNSDDLRELVGNENEMINNNLEFNNLDVPECLNDMVDRVCEDVEKGGEQQPEIQEREVFNDISDIHTDISDKKNTTTTKITPRNTKELSSSNKENDTTRNQRKNTGLRLTYNSTTRKVKKQPPKKGKGKLKIDRAPKMSTILEVRNDEEESERVSKDNAESTKRPDITTPLMRRKRKLYSPKDEDNVTTDKPKVHKSETEEDDIALSELKSNFNPKTSATCYKDIEKDRKKYSRKTRNRKSKSYVEPPSPKTKEMNDIFDHLKDTIESNEEIKVADKTSKDIYNYTSDSEDSDFKQKKIELNKRSSMKTNNQSVPTNKGRNQNRKGDPKTDLKQKAKPKRKAKTTRKINVEVTSDLIDERMREAPAKNLDTSIVNEKEIISVPEEEPNTIKPPEMEVISDDEPTETAATKKTKKNIKAKILSVKKEKDKEKKTMLVDKGDDRTVSPLPGLVVETVPADKDEGNESLNNNILEKFIKIYREGPDEGANTTQNLLFDNERVESPKFNITEDLNCITIDLETASKSSVKSLTLKKGKGKRNEKTRQKSPAKTDNIIAYHICNDNDKDFLEASPAVKSKTATYLKHKTSPTKNKATEKIKSTTKHTERQSEISISTVGISPITAHGDFDKPPPDYGSLKETLKPRDLDIEYLNQSMKDYFHDLGKHARSSSCSKSSSKVKSPVISIKRLSNEDIRLYLPSHRDSDSYEQSIQSQNSTSKVDLEKPPTQRKSLISPIKLFDMNIIKKCDSSKSGSKFNLNFNKPNSGSSQKCSQKKTESLKHDSSVTSREIRVNKHKYNLRKNSKQQENDSDLESVSSIRSRKRLMPPKVFEPKKRRLETENVTLSGSGPSVSSVNEWFTRNMRAAKEDDMSRIKLSFGDTLQNIQEKLDTTLAEIHQNTTREYIKMFVDTQKQLSDMKTERCNVYKQLASELITNFVHLVDGMLTEMDKKAEERENQFIENFKIKACQLIKNDCKQKRAMVVLLKEDLQAVIDHVNKSQE